MRTIVSLALAAAISGLVSTAAAQDPPQAVDPAAARKQEAIVRFQRGIEFHAQGEYDAALSELRRAHELAPAYQVLFNIGQVCVEVRDYACAITSFRTYLKEGGESVAPGRRTAVEADIAQLGSKVAALEIRTSVPGAEIRVDDVRVGTTPLLEPVIVNAGRRRIAASKDGFEPSLRAVDLVGAQESRLDLALAPPAGHVEAARPAPAPAPPAPIPEESPRWTKLSWTGLGITGALVAGAATTGALAWAAETSATETRFAGRSASADVQSDRERAKGLALAADIFAVAAVGTLTTTLVLTFTHTTRPTERAKPAGHVSVGVSGPGASVAGAF